MSKFPSMPLWCADFFSKTDHLSNDEQWAYLKLMMKTWARNCQPFPDDNRDLARLVGLTMKKWLQVRPRIVGFFDLSAGTWRQPHLDEVFQEVERRSETSRENGKLGGRPSSRRINDLENPGHNPAESQAKAVKTKAKEKDKGSLSDERDSSRGDAPPLELQIGGHADVVDRMTEIWNRHCSEFSRALPASASRRKHALARWKDTFSSSFEVWEKYCNRVSNSPYLTGRINGFTADLGWVLEPRNVTKILEGKYDDRAGRVRPDRAAEREARGTERIDANIAAIARATLARTVAPVRDGPGFRGAGEERVVQFRGSDDPGYPRANRS